jgi:hypothetical protein
VITKGQIIKQKVKRRAPLPTSSLNGLLFCSELLKSIKYYQNVGRYLFPNLKLRGLTDLKEILEVEYFLLWLTNIFLLLHFFLLECMTTIFPNLSAGCIYVSLSCPLDSMFFSC